MSTHKATHALRCCARNGTQVCICKSTCNKHRGRLVRDGTRESTHKSTRKALRINKGRLALYGQTCSSYRKYLSRPNFHRIRESKTIGLGIHIQRWRVWWHTGLSTKSGSGRWGAGRKKKLHLTFQVLVLPRSERRRANARNDSYRFSPGVPSPWSGNFYLATQH